MSVHPDHAILYTAKLSIDFLVVNDIDKAPDPPCSPDLAPLDFFLSADAKRQLRGCSFDNTDDLLMKVRDILDGSGRLTLVNAFEEWVMGLRQYFGTEGGYVGWYTVYAFYLNDRLISPFSKFFCFLSMFSSFYYATC
jgi:hypothetical protein